MPLRPFDAQATSDKVNALLRGLGERDAGVGAVADTEAPRSRNVADRTILRVVAAVAAGLLRNSRFMPARRG